jgi:hypothetical protein
MRNARVVKTLMLTGCAVSMGLLSGVAFGSPPVSTVASPGALRSQMESQMGDLGGIAADARQDDDLVRVACVLDKQERANDVMELATSEMLIIRDPETGDQARQFANEKLDAAAARLAVLVEDAGHCAGETSPEEDDDATRTKADEPETIPLMDPTLGPRSPGVPPPMDGQWPPVASAME